jgi:hypothetical protein
MAALDFRFQGTQGKPSSAHSERKYSPKKKIPVLTAEENPVLRTKEELQDWTREQLGFDPITGKQLYCWDKNGTRLRSFWSTYLGGQDDRTPRWVDGYNKFGYNRAGFHINGFNDEGYDNAGFDRHGYNRRGFNRAGWDDRGFNRAGFDKDGFNREGRDARGFDRRGFNEEGYTRKGLDKNGFLPPREELGHTVGYKPDGVWEQRMKPNQAVRLVVVSPGRDKLGYDSNGFNAQGFNKLGYDRAGYNKSGYNREGYNRQGYDRRDYDVFGNKRVI